MKTCEWAVENMFSADRVKLCGKPATRVVFDFLFPDGFRICDEHWKSVCASMQEPSENSAAEFR
jgi:hypothetical protein